MQKRLHCTPKKTPLYSPLFPTLNSANIDSRGVLIPCLTLGSAFDGYRCSALSARCSACVTARLVEQQWHSSTSRNHENCSTGIFLHFGRKAGSIWILFDAARVCESVAGGETIWRRVCVHSTTSLIIRRKLTRSGMLKSTKRTWWPIRTCTAPCLIAQRVVSRDLHLYSAWTLN